jgi:3-phosphoshikimate 1-carboxyvinyltransferase
VSKRTIAPARKISGLVEVPGDKSISHRYALLAALAHGRSEIAGYAAAADCQSTLGCLERLGVGIERSGGANGGSVAITGAGLGGLRHSRRALDAENSGTTMRLLTGILAGQSFDSTLTGDGSLRKRPMRRVIEPLTQMGAHIAGRDGNFAPLEIHGSKLQAIHYTLPVASAQVKSAVLLAGLFAEGETAVEEPVRTRDHTEVALGEFGAARCGAPGSTVFDHGPQATRAAPPRGSGGSLFRRIFSGRGTGASGFRPAIVHNVGLNPTRTAVLDVLSGWGAEAQNRLPARRIRRVGWRREPCSIRRLRVACSRAPVVAQLIDELPMLAALGPYTERGVEIRDASRAAPQGKRSHCGAGGEICDDMGAHVEERPDGLRVEGKAGGPFARRRNRSRGRSPHGHGLRDRGAGRQRSLCDSRRRVRGHLLPRFFLGFGPYRRALAAWLRLAQVGVDVALCCFLDTPCFCGYAPERMRRQSFRRLLLARLVVAALAALAYTSRHRIHLADFTWRNFRACAEPGEHLVPAALADCVYASYLIRALRWRHFSSCFGEVPGLPTCSAGPSWGSRPFLFWAGRANPFVRCFWRARAACRFPVCSASGCSSGSSISRPASFWPA